MSMEIIRVPIFRRCFVDESPLGYLKQIAEMNEYGKYGWMSLISAWPCSTLPARLYPHLKCADWTGFNKIDEFARAILQIDNSYLVATRLRYCPECMRENEYWRMGWKLLYSVACTKHQTYLEDACPHCSKRVGVPDYVNRCNCGMRFMDVKAQPAPSIVVRWQRFLEGLPFIDTDDSRPILSGGHRLTLKQRIAFIRLFSVWANRLSPLKNKCLRDIGISNPDVREVICNASTTMFSGETAYRNFLFKIMTTDFGDACVNQQYFVEFYAEFKSLGHQKALQGFDEINSEFVASEWKQSVSRRKVFTTEVCEAHKWIPLHVIRRKYSVGAATLRRWLDEFEIKHSIRRAGRREIIDVYEPDIEIVLDEINDRISGISAAEMLGVTKAQFAEIRNIFFAKSPAQGHCAEWQFSKKELRKYIDGLLSTEEPIENEAIAVSDILRYYGGKIENALPTLLRAIESKQVTCCSTQFDGIRNLLIDRREFMNWYLERKRVDGHFSIQEIGKKLEINEEFAYQLINSGLIRSIDYGQVGRLVSSDQLYEFSQEYVLLSKMSKMFEVNSKQLRNHLKLKGVNAVMNTENFKLRQLVYKREELATVPFIVNSLRRLQMSIEDLSGVGNERYK